MATLMDNLVELEAAVDALSATDPAELAHGETIVALHRQLERLEAVTARATASFDASRRWVDDGARSAGAWVARRCRLPDTTCRRRIQRGRRLRTVPLTEAARLQGEINHAHVDALTAARTPIAAEAFDRDEAMLVDLARCLPFRSFQRALEYWAQLADPDGTEADADARHDSRRPHLSQSVDGMWFLDGVFDPIGGTIVAEALNRIERELFEADWSEAHVRLGADVTPADVARTPAQRRADAAVELARRAGAVPAGGRLPEPLFTVLVGYETFAGRICELSNGTVVAPGQLVPWLGEGWVERVVFDGPDRVMNVGPRRRIFTGATRRAVEVRDRECFHEFCDVPARDSEIDHVHPYAAGGSTIDSNGRVACRYHHRRRHRRR